jgi:hypothetical protein
MVHFTPYWSIYNQMGHTVGDDAYSRASSHVACHSIVPSKEHVSAQEQGLTGMSVGRMDTDCVKLYLASNTAMYNLVCIQQQR